VFLSYLTVFFFTAVDDTGNRDPANKGRYRDI
jgi:hypothetical protein